VDLTAAIQETAPEYHASIARVLQHFKIVCDAQKLQPLELATSLSAAVFGQTTSAAKAVQILSDLIYGADKFVHMFPKGKRVFQGALACASLCAGVHEMMVVETIPTNPSTGSL